MYMKYGRRLGGYKCFLFHYAKFKNRRSSRRPGSAVSKSTTDPVRCPDESR